MEIIFEEHKEPGYVGRTVENASADVTVAIATNFGSPGEILTKKAALDQGKIYVPIDIKEGLIIRESDVEALVKALNSAQGNNILDNHVTLNIAGNGMFTMRNKYTQEDLDRYVFLLLKDVIDSPDLKVNIVHIRTGGQTGLDESGAKAGSLLEIPTLVMCPKGWLYRDSLGKDIENETLFKRRFGIYV
jgi:hypothetical protein